MVSLKNTEIKLNSDLIKIINWLKEYKKYADYALGILVELDVPESLKVAQEKALKALNIGAYNMNAILEQSYKDTDEREQIERYQHNDDGGDYFECCKCDKNKRMDDFALKHCAGEFECIDCYTKSMG